MFFDPILNSSVNDSRNFVPARGVSQSDDDRDGNFDINDMRRVLYLRRPGGVEREKKYRTVLIWKRTYQGFFVRYRT